MRCSDSVILELKWVVIPWPSYRGRLGPSGPKWQKESEFQMSSQGLSALGAQKVLNGVENKSTILATFRLCLDFLGPEAPRTHLGLLPPLWARRAQMTLVAGKSFRNERSYDLGLALLQNSAFQKHE